jgi:hypothetical protein
MRNNKADRKNPSTVLATNLKSNYNTIINELMLAFFEVGLCVLLYAWFAIARFIFESTQAYGVF